jgi:hypothetical protein
MPARKDGVKSAGGIAWVSVFATRNPKRRVLNVGQTSKISQPPIWRLYINRSKTLCSTYIGS